MPGPIVDIDAAATGINRPASTVRRWVAEGRIPRQGKEHRRVLVDYTDVCRVAHEHNQRGGLDAPPPTM